MKIITLIFIRLTIDSDMDIGDAIIRPSSKGSNHLTISWKINTNCYQHIDILEDKKINEFSIGKRLIIDGEDFEDLDEILARYIGNLTGYVREIMNHKNYRNAEQLNSTFSQIPQDATATSEDITEIKTEVIERALLDERDKNKSKIPYMFTCCTKLPGKFLLSYLVRVKLRNEYIKITQEGFKFREKLFPSFNELIGWFKLHFMDPLPVRAPPPPVQENPVQDKHISSQMGGMSLAHGQNNLSHRTPSYPPPPNRTPAHNNNNNSAFDSIINNSQPLEPAEYSTSNLNDSYSAPASHKYGEYDRDARGGRGGRGRTTLY